MALLNLTLEELGASAQACRVAANQAERDAGRQKNPTVVASFEESARQFRELAETYEAVHRAAARDMGASRPKL